MSSISYVGKEIVDAIIANNPLHIPKEHFGASGINTGKIVYELFRSQYSNTLQYDLKTKHIIVKSSKDIDSQMLKNMLYKKSVGYFYYFPKVKKNRDANGDLRIKITADAPPEIRALYGF